MSKTIGVTGASGFVGRWVLQRLQQAKGCLVLPLPRHAWGDPVALSSFAGKCDVIIHLAGVNRGSDQEVESVNAKLAELLVKACKDADSTPHILYASTVKRFDDTPYGRSKRLAEEMIGAWADTAGAYLTTLVIPNVFGAGCQPFYNSVVATFCHQISNGETPQVLADAELELLWVGDLADRIRDISLEDVGATSRVVAIDGAGRLSVSALLALLKRFHTFYFEQATTPDLTSRLHSTLYSTFLSYLGASDHVYRPPVHADQRGDLCEVVKTETGGQVFFSTTKPGVTRGNHYHTRKLEWFCVVRGEAVIRLRSIYDSQVREHHVSGAHPTFVSIPVLHTHSIENVGDSELLTLFWTSELFDPNDSDTFYEDVLPASKPAATAA